MDNKDILRLKLQDFRAIKEADIKLDGITLVSGVNGCGKSTLSRLLYHIIDDANNYDRLVELRYARQFYALRDTIKRLEAGLDDIQKGRDRDVPLFPPRIRTLDSATSTLERFRSFRQKIELMLPKLSEAQRERINRIGSNGVGENGDVISLLDYIEDQLNHVVSEVNRTQAFRPSLHVWDSLIDVFDKSLGNSDLCLWEYGSVLFHNSQDRINIPTAIDRAIYMDSPISLGIDDYVFSSHYMSRYWTRLREMFSCVNNQNQLKISSVEMDLETKILRGVSSLEENTSYVFERSDGKIFNLLECATGVKSFSIIQMLLRNGWLTKETLLIIDEPEAHLHPQWIVEYARLIVLLNKHIGVKFFLASHSPDMVSAIKYISESEGVSDMLNFYLAEEVDQTMKYRYKSLGADIEPIFASFNIALDRIDQYGASQTEPEL